MGTLPKIDLAIIMTDETHNTVKCTTKKGQKAIRKKHYGNDIHISNAYKKVN